VSPHKIIIDCDPGHDDAIALMLAHGSPEIDLLAVTTVAGNQTLAKVTHNARVVATVAGMRDVPIAAGSDRPMVREPRTAPSIHGETGLDGPVLPDPQVPLDPRPAVDLIIETVLAHDQGAVTLVPLGPLTNIAYALRRHPPLADLVAGVVLMGGGYSKGNVTAAAEFNVYCDPEAAHIVFSGGWPVTQVGIDLTHQALATPDVIDRITALDTEPGRFVRDILLEYGRNYRAAQGFSAPPVHDPCAVARVIDPGVVTTRPAHVEVELAGTHTAGMTVTDFLGRNGAPLDTQVATDLDREKFWELVVDALRRIG
jgi:purine nucleosidase